MAQHEVRTNGGPPRGRPVTATHSHVTSKTIDQKLDIAEAVELLFEFQNGERCEIENDVVCDGSVVDVE